MDELLGKRHEATPRRPTAVYVLLVVNLVLLLILVGFGGYMLHDKLSSGTWQGGGSVPNYMCNIDCSQVCIQKDFSNCFSTCYDACVNRKPPSKSKLSSWIRRSAIHHVGKFGFFGFGFSLPFLDSQNVAVG